MVLTYNGVEYEIDDISTEYELYIIVKDVDAGIIAYRDLMNMQSYAINGAWKHGRIVTKISMTYTRYGDTRIYVKLRQPTTQENAVMLREAKEELESLKALVAPIIRSKINATAVKNLQAAYPDLIAMEEEKEVSDASK